MILGIDSATELVSVAVYDESGGMGGLILAERNGIGPMQHGELLAPTIHEALAQAGIAGRDLTAIAVGVGPGAYTGLRVGLVTARTLGLVWSLPVYGICSLDVVAFAARHTGVVTIDARRKELFWATYDEGVRLDGPFVTRPDDVPADVAVIGLAHPLAADLARCLADEGAELLDPEPLYLRRPDAQVPAAPKRVSA